MYANPPEAEFQGTMAKLKKREIKFHRCLFTSSIKRKIRHSVSRRSRAKTGKNCTKKRDARAKLLSNCFFDVLVAVRGNTLAEL